MTSAKKLILKTPPEPWQLISQSVVAGLADVSVDTVTRARESKLPPIGTLPWKGVGSRYKVPAQAVYDAFNLDPKSPWMPRKEEEIKRLQGALRKLTGAPPDLATTKPRTGLEVLLGLSGSASPTRKKGGKVPVKAIQAILDQLRALDAPARMKINGVLMTFASLGDFLARAQPDDEWLFITPLTRRPMDLKTALYLGCWEGRIELLSLSDYLLQLKDVLAYEAALREGEAIRIDLLEKANPHQ